MEYLITFLTFLVAVVLLETKVPELSTLASTLIALGISWIVGLFAVILNRDR